MSRLALVPGSRLTGRLVVLGVILCGLASVPAGVARAEGPAWRELPSPGAVYGAVAVADPARSRIVLHGGETDQGTSPVPARQLDLGSLSWRDWPVTGDVPASTRMGRGLTGSPAAVDPGEAVVLAICDCTGGGAFELDLGADRWSKAHGDADQVAWAGLLYDAAADRALAIGGRQYGIGDILTRTMAYDMSAARSGWTTLPPVPFQLQDQALALQPGGRWAYSFGGQDQAGNAHDQLWRLDLSKVDTPGAWTLAAASGPPGPPPRMGASLTFVSDRTAILFGGYADGEHLGDAWLLDVDDQAAPTWTRMTFSGPVPPARAAHAAAWDSDGKRLVIVGGTSGSAPSLRILDDAWALDMSPRVPVRLFLPAALRHGAI